MSYQVWVNGKANSTVSIADRGFQFGHGCFETIVVSKRKPLLLDEHLNRLMRGLNALSIPQEDALGTSQNTLEQEVFLFCENTELDHFILKIVVTIGDGGRGYLNPEPISPNRVLSENPLPADLKTRRTSALSLTVSDAVLPDQPLLAGIKHCNRLEQILAKNSISKDYDDAILLNAQNKVIETTSSNFFIVKNKQILTPDLSKQGVAGVIREKILNQCAKQCGYDIEIANINLDDVLDADEVFLSNSVYGVQTVKQLNNKKYNSHAEDHLVSKKLQELCLENEFISNP